MEAPKENKEPEQEIFTINSDKNNSFTVYFINKNSSIYVKVLNQSEIERKEYEKDFSLNELKDNKYLCLFDSIDDIYEEIINIIKQKLNEIKIIEKTKLIIINIPTGSFKIKEIKLYLNEKEINEKEQIKELINSINKLKQENNDLKINQKKLEERIVYLESFIDDIISWKKYKQKIDIEEKNNEKNKNNIPNIKDMEKADEKEDEKINTKYKIEKKKIIAMNSLIIDNDEEYYINLKNWINPNSDIKFKLLYRLSRDGKGFQTFHNLCDNKGITLSLFKLYDGNILGGYTTKDWDDSNSWKKDENAFVFSLTENVKCEVNKNNNYNAIYCNKRCGPFFEPLKFNSSKMDELYFYESNYYNEINKLYPGKTHNYYKVQEVEIFKIEFN